LIALDKNSRTTWKKMEKIDNLVLFLSLEEMVSAFSELG
jgi:hypothetical protein